MGFESASTAGDGGCERQPTRGHPGDES